MAALFRTAPLLRFADTVGDGSGSIDAVGDYSLAETAFKIIPPPGLVFVVHKFSVIIGDAKTMDSGGYGSNGANPLTNGVNFKVVRDGVTQVDFTNGENIKTNGEWAMYMDSLHIHDFGSGDAILVAQLDEAKVAWPRYLDSRAGDEFHFTVNDNLTHLTKHRVLFTGVIRPVELFKPDLYHPV